MCACVSCEFLREPELQNKDYIYREWLFKLFSIMSENGITCR